MHAAFRVQFGPGGRVLISIHGDVPLLAESGAGQLEFECFVVAVELDQEGVVDDDVAVLVPDPSYVAPSGYESPGVIFIAGA